MLGNQICLHQNPNMYLAVNTCVVFILSTLSSLKDQLWKKKNTRSKCGKTDFPVCILCVVKSKCGFADFPCRIVLENKFKNHVCYLQNPKRYSVEIHVWKNCT